MKKWWIRIITFLGHLSAAGVFFLTFWPTASSFLFSPGLMGFDSSQMLFYTHKFSLERVVFPPAGWKFTWFEGTAYIDDIPWLNFYLIQPLVKWLGAFAATKIYFVGAIFVFLIFAYFLFYSLSKNIFLSLALTIALSRSNAIYTQLYDAGVGLSSVAQIALPATFYFLIRYLKEKKKKFMGWAIIALSFGFYTHNLLMIFFGLVPALLFLFFSFYSKEKFFSWSKLKRLLTFSGGVLLLSLPAYIFHFLDLFTGFSVKNNLFQAPKSSDVRFFHLINSTNFAFFIFVVVAMVVVPFLNLRKKLKKLLPLFIILAYVLLFQLSCDLAINPFISVLFPHRFHWVLPLMLGAIIAVLLRQVGKAKILKITLVVVLSFLITITSFVKPSFRVEPGVKTTLESLKSLGKKENLFLDIKQTYEKHIEKVTGVPLELIDGQDINHRLYVVDHGVRLTWNMVYPMPQTHGYWHYYNPKSANWFAWLYATFSYENFEEGGIPEDIAKQQSLFLADWYAVRYLITNPRDENEVAPHFYQEHSYIKNKSANQAPAIIELSPRYVSPIARATDEPVLGFVGDDQAYDYFMRNLGMLNFNSNLLIPIRAANFVEDLTPEQLASFDGLVVYSYRKKKSSLDYQAGWQRLESFVKDGGFVWVETGANCPEKWGEPVPALFPVSQLKAGSLGQIWQAETDFFTDVNFDLLSPLVYEGGTWDVSYVPGENALKPEARVLLKQAGKPVVVEGKKGQGKVIWSGLNLFYRPLHHHETALAEVELQKKIYAELIPLEEERLDFEFERPKPEKVILTFQKGKGVLLKENNYGGWFAYAKVGDEKVRLPILPAGSDFMYAPLPKEIQNQPVTVEFIYKGPWYHWLVFILAITTFLFLIDLIFFNQKIFLLFFLPIKNKFVNFRRRLKKNWDEEN